MSKMFFMALASTHQAEEQREAARAMAGPHLRSQVKREPPLPNELEDGINQGMEGGNSAEKNRHSIAESHRFRDDQPYHNIPLRATAYLCPNTKPKCLPPPPKKDSTMSNLLSPEHTFEANSPDFTPVCFSCLKRLSSENHCLRVHLRKEEKARSMYTVWTDTEWPRSRGRMVKELTVSLGCESTLPSTTDTLAEGPPKGLLPGWAQSDSDCSFLSGQALLHRPQRSPSR